MSQDAARFLPLMAEALKDIYSKMDNVMKKLGYIEENLKNFFSLIGQKNMLLVQNLKKLQGVVTDFKKADSLKNTLQIITENITDIQDGIWYLEFQKALTHFQEKLDEI